MNEAQTGENGSFKFDKVMAGKYRVQLESKDDGFYWNNEEGVLECELNWRKGQECRGNLLISSFEVKGSVNNHQNVLGKHVIFLYSQDGSVKGVGGLPAIRDHPLAGSNQNYVSYARIDKEVKFFSLG